MARKKKDVVDVRSPTPVAEVPVLTRPNPAQAYPGASIPRSTPVTPCPMCGNSFPRLDLPVGFSWISSS
jgi:hypothetical protein